MNTFVVRILSLSLLLAAVLMSATLPANAKDGDFPYGLTVYTKDGQVHRTFGENIDSIVPVPLYPNDKNYFCQIFYCSENYTFSCAIEDIDSVVIKPIVTPDDVVDLGLSVMWSSHNLGANLPEEIGNYYGWGSVTATKNTYFEMENSKWYGIEASKLMEDGVIGPDYNLTPSYDAASVAWGNGWRMPTQMEIDELIEKCTWYYIKYKDVRGYWILGPNDNSIFLPDTASIENGITNPGQFSFYWSSTAFDDWDCSVSLYTCYYTHYRTNEERSRGSSIRPVREKK